MIASRWKAAMIFSPKFLWGGGLLLIGTALGLAPEQKGLLEFLALVLGVLLAYVFEQVWLFATIVIVFNVVPFINIFNVQLVSSLRVQDAMFLLSIVAYGIRTVLHPLPKKRTIDWVGVSIIGLVFYVALRAVLTSLHYGLPMLSSFAFARTYFYYLMYFPIRRLILTHRTPWMVSLLVYGVFFSLAIIIESLAHINLTFITHPYGYQFRGAVVRLFDYGQALSWLSLSFLSGKFLSARRGRKMLVGMGVIICAVSLVLGYSRALTVGIVLGLFLAIMVSVSARGRKLYFVGLVILGLTVSASVMKIASPSLWTQLASRYESTISLVTNDTGTLGYRTQIYQAFYEPLVLQDPVMGVGFVNPNYSGIYYYLPYHSLEDTDLGFVSPLVTMGIVGTGLVFLPFGVEEFLILRKKHSGEIGANIFVLSAVITSLTLVTLFDLYSGIIAAVIALSWLGASETEPVVGDIRNEVPIIGNNYSMRSIEPKQ